MSDTAQPDLDFLRLQQERELKEKELQLKERETFLFLSYCRRILNADDYVVDFIKPYEARPPRKVFKSRKAAKHAKELATS